MGSTQQEDNMAKKPSVDKELHYKKIIQKQKSIIQELKKKMGRADKSKERFDDLEQELIAQMEEEVKEVVYKPELKGKCPDCNKNSFEFIDLKVRKMYVCSSCGYREIKK